MLGEVGCQLHALRRVQLARQGEFDLAVQPPVGPLVPVCGGPVRPRIVRGPFRHMARFPVFHFLGVRRILPFPFDVVRLRRSGLPADPRSGLDVQMVNSHLTPIDSADSPPKHAVS